MKPTQEQIKEFWKWCGLHEALASDGEYHWFDGDEIVSPTDDNHVPVVNLDNLFEWAVPKLQDNGHCVTLQSYECSGYLAFVSETVFSQRGSDGYDPFYKRVSEYEAEDPALALFWALWQVMEKAK